MPAGFHCRRAFVVGALLSSVPLAATGHPVLPPRTAEELAVEAEILAVRQTVLDAIAAKDVAKLKSLYVETYNHVHASGKVDGRDARILSLLAGEPTIETAWPDELAVRVFGKDTAIATGRSPIRGLADGMTRDFRWIVVYVRTKEGWQTTSSQATRLPARP